MFKDILFTVDLNQESSWRKALPTAIELCRSYGARLHVMTVVPDFGLAAVGSYFPEGFEKKLVEDANRDLHAFVAKSVPEGIKVQHIVGHGTVYEEIIETARRIKADLIVMASHRPELRDYLLGPNAARVVRHSECSVLVVRD